MFKQTIQASGFGKKIYAKPQMKAYQVKPMSIICTSGDSQFKTEQLQEEEYGWCLSILYSMQTN